MFKAYVPTKNKECLMKFKGKTKEELLSLEEAEKLDEYAGILDENTVLVDLDDGKEAEILLHIIEDLEVICRVYKTTRGMHFLFKNNDKIKKAGTHCKIACGLTADFKLGTKNGYEVLKFNGKNRPILYDKLDGEEYDEIPNFLLPVKSDIDFLNLSEGDGRNQTLFNYILTLQSAKLDKEEIKHIIKLINTYVFKTPLSDTELNIILRDEAFKQTQDEEQFFSDKGRFYFDVFAQYLMRVENVVKINKRLHIYNGKVYVEGYEEIRRKMIEHLPSLSRANREEVIAYLELIAEEAKTSSENYIAFKNGIYDLTTNRLIDFNSNIIITNLINYNYNEDAYFEITDKAIENLACKDKSIRMLLEEAIGYCFYRRNELRKAFILIGDKRNGKSTFLDLVKEMLGANNVSALDLEEIGDRFRTAEIFGKLANIGDDIDDRYISNAAIFKKVVAGNRITVERKGQDPFAFDPYTKFLFSANDLPRIKDKTGAVLDRLVIIPFNATFTEDDPDYDPYIKYKMLNDESIEYLIQLGLKGLKRVLKTKKFTTNKQVEEELKVFDITNNPIKEFFEEYDVVNQTTNDAYIKYQLYCVENGFQNMTKIEFSRQVKKHCGYIIARKRVDGKDYKVFVSK